MSTKDFHFKEFMSSINVNNELYAFEDYAKDELVPIDRKKGGGHGTKHIYIPNSGELFHSVFPELYRQSSNDENPQKFPIVRHYFDVSNLLSVAAYVHTKIKKENIKDEFNIKKYLSIISSSSSEYIQFESKFKFSKSGNQYRPYFKEFDAKFSEFVRPLMFLDKTKYRVEIYRNEEGELSVFWYLAIGGSKDVDFFKEKQAESAHLPIAPSNEEQHILSKPFLLLAGISGTGKTRFVRQQAETTNTSLSNYCLVPVRPDWHEPSDLLGYVSRINGVSYVATDFLKFMVKAWLNAFEAIDSNDNIVLKDINEINPFWLCLDEMNLAPVEQYFADYLSILETREWEGRKYSCDPILSPNIFNDLGDKGTTKLLNDLGLNCEDFSEEGFRAHLKANLETNSSHSKYQNAFDKLLGHYRKQRDPEFNPFKKVTDAKETVGKYNSGGTFADEALSSWASKDSGQSGDGAVSSVAGKFVAYCQAIEHKINFAPFVEHILKNGISLPPNLIVAGTVNMDETTHGFSRKVIDRALTFDFGDFFPNEYENFLPEDPLPPKPISLTFPRLSSAIRGEGETRSLVDGLNADHAKQTRDFLNTLNDELKGTPFELAYRALNELLLAVVCAQPEDKPTLQAVWDDFLMQKLLPRIDGDDEKLRAKKEGKNSLLEELEDKLKELLPDIWSDDKLRRDLLRQNVATEGEKATPIKIECRSRKKLKWMRDRLDSNGFTSFWP